MANRERGELRLVAPHGVYRLRLVVESCCQLEDLAGRDLMDIVDGANAGRVTDLRWLFWAGLQDAHAAAFPDPESAGAMADGLGGVPALQAFVVALVRLNEDDSPPEHGETPTPPEREPGSRWRRLYIDARRAGIDPDQFWRMSLRELWRELAAQRDRQREAVERDRTMAWMVAALGRAKTLPNLARFVGRRVAPQTPAQMRGMLTLLKAMYPKSTHKRGTSCRTSAGRSSAVPDAPTS